MPHSSIPITDLHRHLDSEQSEPVKMRQLLVWCAQKACEEIVAEKEDPINDLG